MTITYSWKIESMKVTNVSNTENVVFQVSWKKIGKDEDGVEGSFDGATPLPTDKIGERPFIPLEELTEEKVLSWVIPIAEQSKHYDEYIEKQILEKKTIIKEVPLPWLIHKTN